MQSSSSSTLTPFSSFILSLTRPQEKENVPYVVLMQHSYALPNRIIASEPTKANEQMIYKNAGLETPKVTCSMDLTGYLWIQKVWKECIDRCDGRVIIVKCLDNQMMDDSSRSWVGKHGVVIDACSDPLGWNLDDRIQNESSTHGIIHSTMQLQCMLNAIRNAVDIINRSCVDINDRSQRPIPILFDTGSPLIIHHGVDKVSLFLTALKQTVKGVSPVILPTLNESMILRDRRLLEDHADGLISLQNGVMTIVKRSARSGGMVSGGLSIGLRLSKEIQKFEIQNGLLHLKSSSSKDSNLNHAKIHMGREIQEHVEKEADIHATSNLGAGSNINHSLCVSRITLKHEQDDDEEATRDMPQKQIINKPTIYMQDNDPELEDFDEDEPDDDLDI